jgi:hypothetical protein
LSHKLKFYPMSIRRMLRAAVGCPNSGDDSTDIAADGGDGGDGDNGFNTETRRHGDETEKRSIGDESKPE